MNSLPMFPLGTVIFPNQRFELRVFENRYLELVNDIATSESIFGSCLIEKGHEVGGGDTRFGTGTLCEVVQLQRLGVNELHIEVRGIQKISIEEWLPEVKYPIARISQVEDDLQIKFESKAMLEITYELQKCYSLIYQLQKIGSKPPDQEQFGSLNLYQLCDLSPLGQMNRYKLLECESEAQRVMLLLEMITDEREMLEGLIEMRTNDQ